MVESDDKCGRGWRRVLGMVTLGQWGLGVVYSRRRLAASWREASRPKHQMEPSE